MGDDKTNVGFSGLSSLASYVDEAVAKRSGRTGQSGGPRDTQRQGPPQSRPRTVAPTPKREPPPKSEQEVVASGTFRTSPSSSAGAKWLLVLGLVGIGALVWLYNVVQEDIPGASRTPTYTPASPSPPSPSYAPSPAPETQVSDLEFSKPPVGTNHVLSVEQIRWCLREDIRIEVLRPLPTTNAQIDQFNVVVSDYNSRCGSYRYRQGTLMRAQRDVERARAQIVASVRPPWPAARSPGETTSQNPGVEPVQPRPVQQQSQLTLDVQNALAALGYRPGPVDGLYGLRTSLAIQSFQRDIGLAADGQVTQALAERLRQALESRQTPGLTGVGTTGAE